MESIENIKSTYRRIADEAQQKLNKVQRQIYRIGTLRLLLFIAGVAGLICFRAENWTVLAGIALVTLLPFILLLKYHNRLFHRKDYLEKKIEVNRQELAALDYDTSCFDSGEEFTDPAHLYAYDLDVFGAHSLFQYVNRTCTEPGKRLLADWLTMSIYSSLMVAATPICNSIFSAMLNGSGYNQAADVALGTAAQTASVQTAISVSYIWVETVCYIIGAVILILFWTVEKNLPEEQKAIKERSKK